MSRLLALTLLSGLAVAGGVQGASAFWQRSQVSRCNDATTEAERQQLRCWELNAYADPGWPALGAGGTGGAYFLAPGGRARKGGVTRRLG
jgi:hypothetical protein